MNEELLQTILNLVDGLAERDDGALDGNVMIYRARVEELGEDIRAAVAASQQPAGERQPGWEMAGAGL